MGHIKRIISFASKIHKKLRFDPKGEKVASEQNLDSERPADVSTPLMRSTVSVLSSSVKGDSINP